MKKITAVLSAAAMALGLTASVFAAGLSIGALKPQSITLSDETSMEVIQQSVPEADRVVIRDLPVLAQTEDGQTGQEQLDAFLDSFVAKYDENSVMKTEEEVASVKEALKEVLDMVNGENPKEIEPKDFMKTMIEILDIKPDPDDPEETVRTTIGNPIEPNEYEPISKFSELALEDAQGNVLYDEQGKVKNVKAKVEVTDFIGEEDNLENYVIMIVDADGNAHFIELDPTTLKTNEDGTVWIDVDFPCFGLFTILQKSDSMVPDAVSAETETETVE